MNKYFLTIFVSLSIFTSAQNLIFSHKPGFYDNPFYLKVNSTNSTILYSFENNINKRSNVFKDSILIDKTTTISFGVLRGETLEKIESKTFLIDFKTNFKVVSISIDNNFLFDFNTGIYVKGPRAWLDTVAGHYRNTNWERKWEKEHFIEVFNEDGERIISNNAGLRIFGGMTKYYHEKSLRVIFRNMYDSTVTHADLFDSGSKKYKQFILRHSGNDYRNTRFKDAFLTSLAQESELDVQKSSPCHLFINSEYWGVYNIREKINKYYIDNNYSCGINGIDILQGYKTADEGSSEDYQGLLNFLKKNSLSDQKNYQYIKQKMDVRNFINFWIHQIFYANHDVRGNIRFWKSDSLDNKFRWIVYDTDLGFGPNRVNKDLLKDFTSSRMTDWYNPNWATFLLRNLLESNEFKKDFILQSSYIFSTTLSTKNINKRIDEFFSMYNSEMQYHFNERRRFQPYQGSYKKWLSSVNDLRYFAEKRDENSYRHLEKKFGLSDSYILKINVLNDNGKVLINNNTLKSNELVGKFYKNYDIPIKIIPSFGYYHTGFSDSIINNLENDTLEINIDFKKLAPSKYKIIINEVDYVNESIELYNQEDTTVYMNGWTLIDKNNNSLSINDVYINKGNYFVFNYFDTIKKIDGVNYHPLNFKISSVNEKIFLYDNERKIVDSVVYKIDSIKSSYARNIPINKFEEQTWEWNNSDTSTIGYDNKKYQILKIQLEDRLKKESNRRKIFLFSSVGALLVAMSFFLTKKKII